MRILKTAGPLLLTLLAFYGWAATSSAASVQVDVAVSNVLLDDFATPALWSSDGPGALIQPNQGIVHAQVDFFVSIAGVPAPGEVGFGNVNFDVLLSGSLADASGWKKDESTVDHDGLPFTTQVPKWPDNVDLGTPGDLIDIVVGVAPAAFGPVGIDPRRTVGQNGPEFMGHVFASINSDVASSSGFVEAGMKAFSTYDEQGQLGRNDGPAIGSTVSIAILPIACELTGDTRPCDNRISLDDLNNVRNHFGHTGPADGTLTGDAYPFDGMVNIDDLNAVLNNFGETAAAAVPEPAGIATIGLGTLFGLPFRLRTARLKWAFER